MPKSLLPAIASVGTGALVPVVALSLLGLIVGNVAPVPTWMISSPALLRVLIWVAPVLLCALIVARFAKVSPLRFGLLAGASAAASLVVTALASGYWGEESITELVMFLLPELSVSVVLLPVAATIWARRVA
jgi:hypothetical protein